MTSIEYFLAHFGVKGMHWGKITGGAPPVGSSPKAAKNAVTRAKAAASNEKPKKLTFKEARVEKNKFYNAKADRIFSAAAKDPTVLISLKSGYDSYPTVVTGREFIDHMTRGGMMDIKTTDIYATKRTTKADGEHYLLNGKMNEKFVRSDKRKG